MSRTALLTTLAERLGVPREQLVATLENVDLLAVADGGARGGVLTNLNVLHLPGELPNEAAVRAAAGPGRRRDR